MSVSLATLIALLAMTLATYATRITGFLIGDLLASAGPVRRALDALPMAVLTAVITPAVLSGRAEMVAGVVTVLAATRLPLIVTIFVGMAAVAVMRMVFG